MQDSVAQAHTNHRCSPGSEGDDASPRQPNGVRNISLLNASLKGSNSALEDEEEAFSELMEQSNTPSSSGEEQHGLSPFRARADPPVPGQNGISLFDTVVAEQAAQELRRECHALATSLQEKGILVDPSGRACSSPSCAHVDPSPPCSVPNDEAEQQVGLLFPLFLVF